MKKFIYFLVAVMCSALSCTLVACNDDDDTGGTSSSSSDFLEVTLNGRTYTETIPFWGYVILEGTESDSEGNRISLTNVAIDTFADKYGFSFLPSIAHFSSKEKLMSAKTGSYPHQDSFGNLLHGEFYCENFTFVSDVEIGDDYYGLVSGTHQVVSIKDVEDKVQIEGTFTGTYRCERKNTDCEVQGKYRLTLDVY